MVISDVTDKPIFGDFKGLIILGYKSLPHHSSCFVDHSNTFALDCCCMLAEKRHLLLQHANSDSSNSSISTFLGGKHPGIIGAGRRKSERRDGSNEHTRPAP